MQVPEIATSRAPQPVDPIIVSSPDGSADTRVGAWTGPEAGEHHSYEVAEAEPPEAMEMLERGAIDMAFMFHHEDEEAPRLPAFDTVDLGTDHLDLLVPERWNRAGQIIYLNDVSDLPWIMGCVRCRSTAERLCLRAGFEPRTRHITDNPGAIQALVASGLGVALLPRSARRYTAVSGIDPVALDEADARRVTAMIPDALRATSEVDDLLNALRAAEAAGESQ